MTRLPTVHISEISLVDGTKMHLRESDILVIVGPNNCGKTTSLKEIHTLTNSGIREPYIISSLKVEKVDSYEELIDYLEKHAVKKGDQYRKGTRLF